MSILRINRCTIVINTLRLAAIARAYLAHEYRCCF